MPVCGREGYYAPIITCVDSSNDEFEWGTG